jgi:deazaflavin-dependent oxidoreductase (nitroreductase family)
MSVELPPGGTKGFSIPNLARPLMKAGMAMSHGIYRLLGDRMKVQGRPLLVLTTVGARTGKSRKTLLGWFPDSHRDDAWLVVGSGGGTMRHPGWCYNLAKHPQGARIELGGRHIKVVAESLRGEEREQEWKRVVAMAPGYGRYEVKTDRQIPIIRLTPTG